MKFPTTSPMPAGWGVATRPEHSAGAEIRAIPGGLAALLLDGPLLERSDVTARLVDTLWETLTDDNIPWAQRPGTALTLANATLSREQAGSAARGSAAAILVNSTSLFLAHTGNVRLFRVLHGGGIAPLNRPFSVPWGALSREEGGEEAPAYLGGAEELRLAAPRHPINVQPRDLILMLSEAAAGTSTPWASEEAVQLAPEDLALRCLDATEPDIPSASTIVLQVPPQGLVKPEELPRNRFEEAGKAPTTRVGSTHPRVSTNATPSRSESPRLWLAASVGLALATLLFFGMNSLQPAAPPQNPANTAATLEEPRPKTSAPRRALPSPGQAERKNPPSRTPEAPKPGLDTPLPSTERAQPLGNQLSRGLLRSPRNLLDVLRGRYRLRLIAGERPQDHLKAPLSLSPALQEALAAPEGSMGMESVEWAGAIQLRAARIVALVTSLVLQENLAELRSLETALTQERSTPISRATFEAILAQNPEPIIRDWALIHLGKLR